MSTINNIFTIKQKGDYVYEYMNTQFNTSRLTLTDTINTEIYIYKDLQLHVNNKQKTYFKTHNNGHHINNNIIIQRLSIVSTPFTTFPLIDKYDNIISRQTKIYYDNKTKINVGVVCDTIIKDQKKECITYLQINGDYVFENILKLLSDIFKL